MQQDSLGTILKHYREEAGISIEKIEEALKISKRNIVALEEGRYTELPENLYTKNFVESYARYLGLSVPKIHALYTQERTALENETTKKNIETNIDSKSISLTPTHLKIGAGIVVGLSLVLYLAIQIRHIFIPPQLTILSPAENIITDKTFINISGQTEKEAIIHINDKEINIDRDGFFAATLDLKTGINIIKISSKKKNSKENVIFREILVEEKEAL